MKFVLKVLRNGFILAGIFFFSFWAGTDTLCWADLKTVVIFFCTYVFAELARYFKLNTSTTPTRKKTSKLNTLIFA